MDSVTQTDHSPPMTGPKAVQYIERELGLSLDQLNIFPRFILIEPINTCNARCIMCGIDFDSEGRVRTRIADSLFEKLATEICAHRNYVEKVMLYLDCEPLMDRQIDQKIRRLKSDGIRRVNIASNGSMLNEKRSTEIIEAGLDEIYLSVDSLYPEVFAQIRPGLQLETVLRNTHRFIELRNRMNPNLVIRVQAVLQEPNQNEVQSIKRYWAKYLGPLDQIAIQKAHNWAGNVEVMQFGDEGSANEVPCIALWGTIAIHANGRVGMCCLDTETRNPIGDVNYQSIAEIWKGPALAAVRKLHTTGCRSDLAMCDGCTLWRESKRELQEISRT